MYIYVLLDATAHIVIGEKKPTTTQHLPPFSICAYITFLGRGSNTYKQLEGEQL